MKASVLLLLALSCVHVYGQTTVACGASDDTPAIQAALNTKKRVILPEGDCRVTSLNITNRQGVTLEGQGALATNLVPTQPGANVIDVTGSSNITLRNFRIFGTATPDVVPSTGILNAQMAGSYASDVTTIEHVRVEGYFSLASWYNLAVASSYVNGSQFYNYEPGGITAILTGNNFFGASSSFVPIDNSNSHVPSDWTIVATEFHNFGNGWTFWIGGAQSIRVYGGNMSSQHAIVSMNSAVINGANSYPAAVIFDGTTFYSDNGIQPPCAVQGLSSGQYVTFRANQFSMPATGC
jgi:hypothetical protein